MAYEDWSVGGDLVGLPTLVCNPSRRVRRASCAACATAIAISGRPEDDGRARGAALDPRLRPLARGPRLPALGRAFPRRAACRSSFGGDPRERWWRLIPLQTKLGVLELRARQRPERPARRRRRARCAAFVDRLSREIGRVPRRRARRRRASTISGATTCSALLGRRRRRRRRGARRASPMTCSRAGRTAAWITCWRGCRARARCAG